MTGIKWIACLVVLTSPWASTSGDTDVSCVFMASCTLPCSSEGGTDVVVHWFQISAGNLFVHSYYKGQDHLEVQNQRFRGRTALFGDQLAAGNASLQLTGVKVQDEGKYQCLISTVNGRKESFINLKMDVCMYALIMVMQVFYLQTPERSAAPIHDIDIQQVGNIITCSSEGIYPQPELTWSTRPPSNVNHKCKTGLRETEQHLYDISSSVTSSAGEADLSFFCTISTRRNMRTVTLPSTSLRNSGAIVGGVITAIIVVAVIAAVGLLLLKRRREQQEKYRRASRRKSDTELQPM